MKDSPARRPLLRRPGKVPRHSVGVALVLAAAAVAAGAVWLARATRSADPGPGPEPRGERIWIVDAGFATQYPAAARAIEDAGGRIRVYDFPGATLPNGKRYAWARDYGPLAMPPTGGESWTVWDARNGGSATPELEHAALRRLAALLGAPYRTLDLVLQGGNWLPLPDGRVITSGRFFEDNRAIGSRTEIESTLRSVGVGGLIEIAPMPGELTRHADMVLAVDPATGNVFVGELWPEAIDLVPADAGWDMYRDLATAIRGSLDRTAVDLRAALGQGRVFRFPQPLPHLDRHPEEDRYRPTFPSFVNGIFVVDATGRSTYLYGLARGGTDSYYSFDASLLEAYRQAVDRVARSQGFRAVGVETGDLVRHGGSLHCATVEAVEVPRRQRPDGR